MSKWEKIEETSIDVFTIKIDELDGLIVKLNTSQISDVKKSKKPNLQALVAQKNQLANILIEFYRMLNLKGNMALKELIAHAKKELDKILLEVANQKEFEEIIQHTYEMFKHEVGSVVELLKEQNVKLKAEIVSLKLDVQTKTAHFDSVKEHLKGLLEQRHDKIIQHFIEHHHHHHDKIKEIELVKNLKKELRDEKDMLALDKEIDLLIEEMAKDTKTELADLPQVKALENNIEITNQIKSEIEGEMKYLTEKIKENESKLKENTSYIERCENAVKDNKETDKLQEAPQHNHHHKKKRSK